MQLPLPRGTLRLYCPSRGAIAASLKGLRPEASSPIAGNSQLGSSLSEGNFPAGREQGFLLEQREPGAPRIAPLAR